MVAETLINTAQNAKRNIPGARQKACLLFSV